MRLFALPLFALCAAALPQTRDTNSSADGLAQTAAILEATNTFLSLLTEDQRAGALFPYDSQDTAAAVLVQGTGPVSARQFLAEGFGQSLWSNYPYGYIPRPGVKAGNLTDVQYQAMLGVLSAMLSEEGYSKVHDIMAADAWLGEMAAATNVSLVGYASSLGEYGLGIFGEPSLEDKWMIQFGGHHVGLNLVMYQDKAVMAPLHTAIWANIFEEDGVEKRGLAGENDKAFALWATLDDDLRAQATINHTVTELIQGPGMVNDTATEGVSVSLFNATQQELLFDIVSEWAGVINSVHGAARLAEISASLEDAFFAWSGPDTHEPGQNGESYYRIQGPNLYVEYSPQYLMGYDGLGGGFQGPTTHVHSVYRTPSDAYGLSLGV